MLRSKIYFECFSIQDSETKPSENDDDDDSVTRDHDNKRQQPGHHKHKDEVEKFLRFHSFKSVFQEEIWFTICSDEKYPMVVHCQ